MALSNPVIEQRVVQALRVLALHMKVCAGYVFGSHVDGTPDAYSDIDLAVFVEGLEAWNIFQRADIAAPGKFEVKRHGALSHSNNCMAIFSDGYCALNFAGSAI